MTGWVPDAGLLDLLLPRACLGCGERIPPEDPSRKVCARCRALLRAPPPPRCFRCDLPLGTGHPEGEACPECVEWPESLVTARAAYVMEPPADALIHALKYGGWRSLAGMMAGRMARLPSPAPAKAPVIPVPTTRRRERMRGYNQAGLLAEEVARLRGALFLPALGRDRGGSQVRMGPRAREANVQGSFRVRPSFCSRIEGREVILVDDVLTTGATARSAVETLAGSGVVGVHLLTFARAIPYATGIRRAGSW